jgi:tryptophan synthase beta subunit
MREKASLAGATVILNLSGRGDKDLGIVLEQVGAAAGGSGGGGKARS